MSAPAKKSILLITAACLQLLILEGGGEGPFTPDLGVYHNQRDLTSWTSARGSLNITPSVASSSEALMNPAGNSTSNDSSLQALQLIYSVKEEDEPVDLLPKNANILLETRQEEPQEGGDNGISPVFRSYFQDRGRFKGQLRDNKGKIFFRYGLPIDQNSCGSGIYDRVVDREFVTEELLERAKQIHIRQLMAIDIFESFIVRQEDINDLPESLILKLRQLRVSYNPDADNNQSAINELADEEIFTTYVKEALRRRVKNNNTENSVDRELFIKELGEESNIYELMAIDIFESFIVRQEDINDLPESLILKLQQLRVSYNPDADNNQLAINELASEEYFITYVNQSLGNHINNNEEYVSLSKEALIAIAAMNNLALEIYNYSMDQELQQMALTRVEPHNPYAPNPNPYLPNAPTRTVQLIQYENLKFDLLIDPPSEDSYWDLLLNKECAFRGKILFLIEKNKNKKLSEDFFNKLINKFNNVASIRNINSLDSEGETSLHEIAANSNNPDLIHGLWLDLLRKILALRNIKTITFNEIKISKETKDSSRIGIAKVIFFIIDKLSKGKFIVKNFTALMYAARENLSKFPLQKEFLINEGLQLERDLWLLGGCLALPGYPLEARDFSEHVFEVIKNGKSYKGLSAHYITVAIDKFLEIDFEEFCLTNSLEIKLEEIKGKLRLLKIQWEDGVLNNCGGDNYCDGVAKALEADHLCSFFIQLDGHVISASFVQKEGTLEDCNRTWIVAITNLGGIWDVNRGRALEVVENREKRSRVFGTHFFHLREDTLEKIFMDVLQQKKYFVEEPHPSTRAILQSLMHEMSTGTESVLKKFSLSEQLIPEQRVDILHIWAPDLKRQTKDNCAFVHPLQCIKDQMLMSILTTKILEEIKSVNQRYPESNTNFRNWFSRSQPQLASLQQVNLALNLFEAFELFIKIQILTDFVNHRNSFKELKQLMNSQKVYDKCVQVSFKNIKRDYNNAYENTQDLLEPYLDQLESGIEFNRKPKRKS